MHEKITAFLDSVCGEIGKREVHEEIREELQAHILEKAEKEGVEKAVESMGNPLAIGAALHKEHKPKTDWFMLLLVLLLAGCGALVMINNYDSGYNLSFGKYQLCVGIGLCAFFAAWFFRYDRLKKLALPLCISAAAILIATQIFGYLQNGRRYFMIAGIHIAPDVALFLFLIGFAGLVEKSKGKGMLAVVKLFGLSIGFAMLFMLLPFTTYAILTMLASAAVLLTAVKKGHFGGVKKLQLYVIAAPYACGGILLAASLVRFGSNRLTSFFSRGQTDPQGGGWIYIMVDKWLSASRFFGAADAGAVGYSIDKSLPSVATDYAFVNMVASFGWVLGIAFLALVALLIVRMLFIVRRIKNSYGYYLFTAACTLVTMQFLIGILINLNLFPLTSISLPFISYGPANYVVNMLLMGLMLSVYRRNRASYKESA